VAQELVDAGSAAFLAVTTDAETAEGRVREVLPRAVDVDTAYSLLGATAFAKVSMFRVRRLPAVWGTEVEPRGDDRRSVNTGIGKASETDGKPRMGHGSEPCVTA
jgi:hypothetical protein